VAAADAVRRGLDDEAAPTPTPTTTQRVSASFPQNVFPGRLLYADTLCELHGVDLATGAELPFRARDIQSCRGLWAPITGEYMVIGLEDGDGDENVSLMLRKGDTGESDSDKPLAAARPERVVTGQEYGEIGWCDRQGRGGMLRPFRNVVERVRGCPVGFLLNGRVVAQRGQELLVGDRRVRTLAPGTFVVGVSEHRLAVFDRGKLTVFPAPSNPHPSVTVDLPDIQGRPLLAPDGCAVLYPALELGERATVRVRNLGCGLAIDREFNARGSGWRDGEATWSPDGTWIAIAGADDAVRLYRSDGGGDPVRLPAPAEYLAWTG
jgi:hypothetical protein